MEKQAAISADEPCLYGCTHCISAGVRQFGFRSSIDPDCMGIDFDDGTVLTYWKRKRQMKKLLDMAEQLSERYLISEVMELPEQAEDQVYYQLLKMAGKSMLEQVGEVERERLEYKEYIEQWIHEIKTPITAMKLLCENHRMDWTKELLLELEKTNRFTEQALYYARSEHTEKDYSVREMVLSQVVHGAIADNKYLLLHSGMRLEVEEMQDTVYSAKSGCVLS